MGFDIDKSSKVCYEGMTRDNYNVESFFTVQTRLQDLAAAFYNSWTGHLETRKSHFWSAVFKVLREVTHKLRTIRRLLAVFASRLKFGPKIDGRDAGGGRRDKGLWG